ncbi:MAG: NAD(P)/FAD-dependent oxidoreductase [Pyrinomonadaceae bacterium]|nr:NAD(P)/FAD-dependent oxidoreductase [Pyrinomonadaceae bacterium]
MSTNQKRVVIVGGGFGGLFTALDLASSCEVALVSPEDHFLFTPMLYEYVSGEVEAWHIAPRYKELLNDSARFIRGRVREVNFDRREVSIEGRDRPLVYDALVLACGGVTNYWDVEGAEEFALPFRTLAHADDLRARMIRTLDRVPPDATPEAAREALTFAIVGGGASGVELATKISDLLRDAFRRRGLQGEARVMLLEMGDRIVPGMGKELREYVTNTLNDKRVEVHTESRVLRITSEEFYFEQHERQVETKAAGVVWTAGVRVNPLIETLELEKNERGLILVEDTMQARGREGVFAIGDIADYRNVASPNLAGTAQLANQEAVLLASNIRALFSGRPLKTKTLHELGEALSLGTENAAVLSAGQVAHGALARQARFALYTARLPTWHHRLRVGSSWFFEGTSPRPLAL